MYRGRRVSEDSHAQELSGRAQRKVLAVRSFADGGHTGVRSADNEVQEETKLLAVRAVEMSMFVLTHD